MSTPTNLFRGWPNPSLHPTAALAAASAAVLSTPSLAAPALSYGPDQGALTLREQVGRWLGGFYYPNSLYTGEISNPVGSERICISGGASQNLACLLQTFTDVGYTRNVWMVAPTYYLACRIFEDAGFAGRLRAVPEDAEGVDLEVLEAGLRGCEQRERDGERVDEPTHKPPRPWRKIYKHIIYTTSTFSNPSSCVMSLRRRERLVRLARKYDALIVSDDVYDFLQWPAQPMSQSPTQTASPSTSVSAASPGEENQPFPTHALVPRIVDVDRYLDGGPVDEWGNAMSNGSFSKIVGPGCRVGWAEGTKQFAYGLSQTASSRSGGCPSQLSSSFLTHLLSTNTLQTHIRSVLQPSLSRRYHALTAAVRMHLVPLGVELAEPSTTTDSSTNTNTNTNNAIAGGYFLWLRLPAGVRASELAKRAQEEENLVVAGGNLFQVSGAEAEGGVAVDNFQRFVRLCFAWEEEGRFEEAVVRLARVIGREMEGAGAEVRDAI
ncbi:hypothetical protein FQN53_001001 [Emmonsiellopsis sp. PD_33]|nr:hypothetical protein FQN53_001001 [Emmonsiellopsis sp. PD_33]KAK2800906.1 hypothetical protein FQN51_005841 [Onygenales sp. PD_10]